MRVGISHWCVGMAMWSWVGLKFVISDCCVVMHIVDIYSMLYCIHV